MRHVGRHVTKLKTTVKTIQEIDRANGRILRIHHHLHRRPGYIPFAMPGIPPTAAQPPLPPSAIIRLGDLIHRIIFPIARFMDRTFRTQLTTCTTCGNRQAKLNRFDGWIRTQFKKLLMNPHFTTLASWFKRP